MGVEGSSQPTVSDSDSADKVPGENVGGESKSKSEGVTLTAGVEKPLGEMDDKIGKNSAVKIEGLKEGSTPELRLETRKSDEVKTGVEQPKDSGIPPAEIKPEG